MKNKKLSHKQISAKGGKATVEKYGKEHMSNLAKQGWVKRKQYDKGETRVQEVQTDVSN